MYIVVSLKSGSTGEIILLYGKMMKPCKILRTNIIYSRVEQSPRLWGLQNPRSADTVKVSGSCGVKSKDRSQYWQARISCIVRSIRISSRRTDRQYAAFPAMVCIADIFLFEPSRRKLSMMLDVFVTAHQLRSSFPLKSTIVLCCLDDRYLSENA